MWAFLRDIDRQLFFWINDGWSNSFLDAIMPYWRDKWTWVPLYALILGWLIWRYKKQSWRYILLLAVTVALTDLVSSSVIKPWIGRLRPCNTPELAEQIRVLIHCGPGKSFTSSHATNHFGLAVMVGLLWGKENRWLWPLALFWAATIAIGQVYVGVHYPFDILGGALLGSSIAFIVYRIAQFTRNQRTFAGS